MVFKSSSVLSCLIPSRLGFGSNQRPDSPSRTRDQEKHRLVAHERLGEQEFDPFRGNPLPLYRATDPDPCTDHPDHSRARANTAPSGSLPPALLIPDGGIGHSPSPLHRPFAPPVRPKRSSFTTFFAFSSKRGPAHGAPIVHFPQLQQDPLVPSQSAPDRWASDSGQTQVHLVNPASIPSPLRTDEEYYCSNYASATPTFPSHPDATNAPPFRQLSLRQDLSGNPDLDSHLSSPVNSHPSHTQFRHPYAYSSPLYPRSYSKTFDTAPRLRHTTSQPFQHHPQAGSGILPAQLGHEISKLQPELKTSMSTPNLASGAPPVRPRSLIRKKPPSRSKGQERWLSAESWWDALFSPSPRFKVKQAPRPNPVTEKIASSPVSKPVPGEPNRNLGVTFPSVPAARPRAISATSATSNIKPTVPALTRSRSAVDILGQPSTSATPRAGFEPALETLVDGPTPPPEQVPENDAELSLPDPPLSLEQVLDEGEAFEHQRAQWKQQASKSLGNKHTRSFSRARSKSLGERHVRLAHHTSESSKAHFNLEFLAARTLLGSQSTMPTVHVTKPNSSSSHSKAYSHSHSQSAYSCSRSSRSRTYSHSHSHSHSHSLATSSSSKSSRHLPPRGHSRNGSWGKTALLKAVALCGIAQDESYTTDEKVPSSSRADVQGTVHIGHSTNDEGVSDVAKVSPSPSVPSGEVGIAISSSPPSEGSFHLDMFEPRHQEGDLESRWSSKHTHKSSEYAGPHPSAIDSNLPQLGAASGVSLRHRLPPRAVIHPPIASIVHPYRSMTARPERVGDKESESATLKVTEGQGAMEPGTGRIPYPHISLSHADFERYGVGEALVYASLPRQKEVPEAKQAGVQTESLPAAELPPQEQSPCETTVVQPEERATSSLAIPSLTSSTIQMVMSAFDNPDDLDEFRDLFYKPRPASGGQHREPWVMINQMPTDVRSSAPGSPLTHLVRKLSEEVNSRRDPSRTPSDPILLQRSESQEDQSNQSGTKFVFMDLARTSSSPRPMESSSQLHVPIQEGSESTAQPVMVIPEDVNSFYTSSILDGSSGDHENDTFGYPVKHGQCEVATAPTPIQSPNRLSTHLSIREDEDEDEEDETAFLSPVTKRYGLVSVDAVRASYLTTSDLSQMSGLSDFPLPPSARPVSILQAYSEAPTPLSASESHGQSDDGTEMGHRNRHVDGEEDVEPSGDVEVTLRALRMTPRVTSYESRGSTYGGSDDTDPVVQLHQA